MTNGAGKPKPAFFVAVLVVAAGLVGMALWRCNKKSEGEKPTAGSNIDLKDLKPAENPDDTGGVTTVKEYTFEPAQKLPEIPETGAYQPLNKTRTVKMAINVWAGWAPIIYANGGMAAKKVWKDAKGQDFLLDLQLIDNPIQMTNVFAKGDIHLGWGTVDMLPLLMQRLEKDKRAWPRVIQQIDWSNGGDGIVVRENIKTVADLRGKTVTLAQNSPSHYFLLNVLLNGGVQPWEVDMKFAGDAFQAAAAYKANKDIAGVVTWAPDIYTLTENVKTNRLLITTGTANKLIADVYFARADFARDNPDILEGMVRGILDAVTELKDDAKKEEAAKLLDAAYNLPPGTGKAMLPDAHWCNYAENYDFFLNQNNPTNFERTYNTAYLLYKAVPDTAVRVKIPFDQIVDFSFIKKLKSEEKYANQKNEYQYQFTPASSESINVESAVLTKTVVINFFPNSFDLFKKVESRDGSGMVLYDPHVEHTVEEIAKLAGQFGAARIQISGHTDASMRGVADERLVRELSLQRANSVKQGLLNKFNKLDPNQFVVAGYGWDKPADPNDPENHAKNRRVEIKVIPAEAQ
jgi:NitT/TauT family transport system substrate-binding protein